MVDIDRKIHALAAPQHGTFSRTQARAIGITRHHLSARLANGSLDACSAEVLAIAGAAHTVHQQAISAVLDAGPISALSHESAAAHWSLDGFEMLPLQVIRARGRRVYRGGLANVHTTTYLPPHHLTVVDGLTLTVPVRTIFDLAGTMHPGRLARLVDGAWRKHYVSGRLLRRTLVELAEQGRPGIQNMREICEVRGEDYRPTDSNVEARFLELMHQIGVHSFERQTDLGGIDWIGRVDFIDRELRLVVEIDSDTFHLSLTDRARDSARRAAVEAAGFTVESIRDFDVWHDPNSVKERIRILRRRLAGNLWSERSG